MSSPGFSKSAQKWVIAAMACGTFVLPGIEARASNITVVNNCSYQIAIGVYPAVYANGGAFLGAGQQVTFGQWASGTGGRVWSRHNCVPNGSGPDTCSSGQCGGSGIACAGSTAAGVSEAEINFNASGTDWYDISYVDGYNDMVKMAPSNGAYTPSCTSKPGCPTVTGNGYGGAGDTCLSPCTAYNTDQYCCRNAYGTSASCDEGAWPAPGSTYVNSLHSACNGEYTYAYDDSIGLHTTPTGPNYTITFCPNGGGTTGGGTSGGTTGGTTGGQISPGIHTLTPACATGSRLDDSGGGTTNGNPVQIWQAAGNVNQQWNFASLGNSDWNMAVNLGPYCLDSRGGPQGTQVGIWSCVGNTNQKWHSADGNGGTNFYNYGDGLCLDVWQAGSANGTKVDTYTCNGTSAQAWLVQ